MHDVTLGPHPDRHGVPPQILGHVFGGDHGPIGRVARNARLAIVRQLRPDGRAQSIGAHEGRAAQRCAIGEGDRVRVAFLRIGHHLAVGAQLDERRGLAGPLHDAVQLAPMDDRIGVLKARAEGLVQGQRDDFLGSHRVHDLHGLDVDREGARGFPDPEMIERAKRVGAELDARADLAEARGALQHDGGHPDLGEGQCCRETADPSSRDQNGVRNSHGDASPSDLRTGMPFA